LTIDSGFCTPSVADRRFGSLFGMGQMGADGSVLEDQPCCCVFDQRSVAAVPQVAVPIDKTRTRAIRPAFSPG